MVGRLGTWIASSFGSVFSKAAWKTAAGTGVRGTAKLATVGGVGAAGVGGLGMIGSGLTSAKNYIADKLGYASEQSESDDPSLGGGILFGALAGVIGLVGALFFSAPAATIALVAGGLALAGAAGGALFGKKSAEDLMAAVKTPSQPNNNTGDTEPAQGAETSPDLVVVTPKTPTNPIAVAAASKKAGSSSIS